MHVVIILAIWGPLNNILADVSDTFLEPDFMYGNQQVLWFIFEFSTNHTNGTCCTSFVFKNVTTSQDLGNFKINISKMQLKCTIIKSIIKHFYKLYFLNC